MGPLLRKYIGTHIPAALFALGLVQACGSTALDGVQRGATGAASSGTGSSTKENTKPSKSGDAVEDLYLDARYKIRAGIVTSNASGTTNNSAQVCDGSVVIQVSKKLGTDGNSLLQVPEAAVNCALVGKIDLQKALGAFSAGLKGTPKNPFITADDVLSLEKLGPGTYSPPRPILPSLLAAKKSALRTLDLTRNLTLSTSNQSGTGTVNIKTLSYDQPIELTEMRLTVPYVQTFSVTNIGFDKLDKAANMIFDTLTMGVSVNPPAITSLSVQGSLQLLLAAANANGTAPAQTNALNDAIKNAANGLAGLVKIRIDLDLVEQEDLANAVKKSLDSASKD